MNKITINPDIYSVEAFAPASSANFAVGYDLIGFAIEGVGDIVKLVKRDDDAILIQEIEGVEGTERLPYDDHNVCIAIVKKFLADYQLKAGFDIYINKGISLSSGMGGSAASAVATITALNGFFKRPLPLSALADYTIYAESLISGGVYHGDNAIPSLYGGLVLIQNSKPCEMISLPTVDVKVVIVHPHIEVETREAKKLMQAPFHISEIVQQSGNLAAFICALYRNDIDLLAHSLHDVLAEPRRSKLIIGFDHVKQAAMDNGALASSISGSGPSMFAVARDELTAKKIAKAMVKEFTRHGLYSEYWISPLNAPGAAIKNIETKTTLSA